MEIDMEKRQVIMDMILLMQERYWEADEKDNL